MPRGLMLGVRGQGDWPVIQDPRIVSRFPTVGIEIAEERELRRQPLPSATGMQAEGFRLIKAPGRNNRLAQGPTIQGD